MGGRRSTFGGRWADIDEVFSFSEPQLQPHIPPNYCLATEKLFSFSVVRAPCTDGGIVYHFSKTTGIVYLFSFFYTQPGWIRHFAVAAGCIISVSWHCRSLTSHTQLFFTPNLGGNHGYLHPNFDRPPNSQFLSLQPANFISVYLCIESMIRALAIHHRHRTHMLQLRILEQQLTHRNPRWRGVDRASDSHSPPLSKQPVLPWLP